MLDKYTAYLSSPTIHLEQMKASYQLEGVCCDSLSILSLSLCPLEAASTGEGGFKRVFTRHLAWSLSDRLAQGKTHTLVVVAIRAAVALYFPNVYFKSTVCLFTCN